MRVLMLDEITIAMLLSILEEHRARLYKRSERNPLHDEDREYIAELSDMIATLSDPDGGTPVG